MIKIDISKIMFEDRPHIVSMSESFEGKYGRRPFLKWIACVDEGDTHVEQLLKDSICAACELCHIDIKCEFYSSDILEEDLIDDIHKFNSDEDIDGIVIPDAFLPKGLSRYNVYSAIDEDKDVMCVNPLNFGSSLMHPHYMKSPMVDALNRVMQECHIDTLYKKFVIVSDNKNLATPLMYALCNRDMHNTTVSILSNINNEIRMEDECKSADVIINTINKSNIIKDTMLNKEAIVIDFSFLCHKDFDKNDNSYFLTDGINYKVRFNGHGCLSIIDGLGALIETYMLRSLIYLAEERMGNLEREKENNKGLCGMSIEA